jgi:hypothetical protein
VDDAIGYAGLAALKAEGDVQINQAVLEKK